VKSSYLYARGRRQNFQLSLVLDPEIMLDPCLARIGQHDVLHRGKVLAEPQLLAAIAAH
jgi:hypothetical protein